MPVAGAKLDEDAPPTTPATPSSSASNCTSIAMTSPQAKVLRIVVAATAFAAASASAVAADPTPLRLRWGVVETSGADAQAESDALKASLSQKPARAPAGKAGAPARAAYVVQFEDVVTAEWRAWLESATQVRGYVPENAYLVWATAGEMEEIASGPGVHWVGEWKKEYKTARGGAGRVPAAKAAAGKDAAAPARRMHVRSLLAGDAGADDLRARLEALGATVLHAAPRLDGSAAVALLDDNQVDQVASWPDVQWIEPQPRPRLFNDQAARTNMMNVIPAWKSLSAGGLGLTGAGQIVAVADTGCDKGILADVHPDFAGRILAGYGWSDGQYADTNSWADYHSHGTHVCGSVLGSGALSGGQYRGMAYEAMLVMQGMQSDLSGLPWDFQDVLSQAYKAGARIHSDSWGYGHDYAGLYGGAAIDVDEFTWRNQDFLVLFAAGNDGIDADTNGVIDAGSVTPPGTAKNCIAVGASENYRDLPPTNRYAYTYGGKWPGNYPAAPIFGDRVSQTAAPQGLAAFSGRGPTLDGRIKPDIVAPGTDVVSVRGRFAESTCWGVFESNTNYIYSGGTSMATPLAAGAAALVRQWLVDRRGVADPPAALVKALLVNGARDMTPGQYGTGAFQEISGRPDCSQGFGHVNLYDSLEHGEGRFLSFETNRLAATGSRFSTRMMIWEADAGRCAVTLVWQDYPGTEGAGKALVNDLDLSVVSPSGAVYYPNGLGEPDRLDNVEFVEFDAEKAGRYEIRVDAHNIAKTTGLGAQPFALVLRYPKTSPGLIILAR